MYLGMTLIDLGVTVLTAAVWSLLFLPLPVLVVDRRVIPMEERHLIDLFGATCLASRGRVRRRL